MLRQGLKAVLVALGFAGGAYVSVVVASLAVVILGDELLPSSWRSLTLYGAVGIPLSALIASVVALLVSRLARFSARARTRALLLFPAVVVLAGLVLLTDIVLHPPAS
jgi:hypothetical protein